MSFPVVALYVVPQCCEIKPPPEAVDLEDVIALGAWEIACLLLFHLAEDLSDRVSDGALRNNLLLNHLLEQFDQVVIRLMLLSQDSLEEFGDLDQEVFWGHLEPLVVVLGHLPQLVFEVALVVDREGGPLSDWQENSEARQTVTFAHGQLL